MKMNISINSYGIEATTFKTATKDVRPENNKQEKMF